MLFDWDHGNWPKCGEHGVSRSEIEALFDTDPMIFGDPQHSLVEQRFKAIGRTSEDRHLLVVFTIRIKEAGPHYRPISARYMHLDEVEEYEEANR